VALVKFPSEIQQENLAVSVSTVSTDHTMSWAVLKSPY